MQQHTTNAGGGGGGGGGSAASSAAAATASGGAPIISLSDSKVKAISSFLSLCEKATIDLNGEGLSNALKASIVLCMKFVDKEALFKAVLPSTFVDWVYVKVQASSKKNLLGDASTWLQLMQFVDFGEPTLSARVLQSQYPPLYCIHAAIGAQRASKLTFSDACKILLFNNVEGLTSRTMIELHTSARLEHNTYTICTSIINALADERHSADVYESTFKYVLGALMKVDEQSLAQHIAHFKQTAAVRVKAWEMKAIQSRICRPSMRKVAEAMAALNISSTPSSMSSSHNDGHNDGMSSSNHLMGGGGGGGMDGTGVSSTSFEAHSVLVRYPNSMSNLRRLRCYLLACQVHNFAYQHHLHELVSSDVARTLAENPVSIPEPHSLYAAVDSLAMNMRPFPELDLFRTRCFVSFASHQKRSLTLTQVLKLYVAAYQFKPIWKQLWTMVFPVISPQIIRDVETFVASTPFAVGPFVQILKTSTPFSVS